MVCILCVSKSSLCFNLTIERNWDNGGANPYICMSIVGRQDILRGEPSPLLQ